MAQMFADIQMQENTCEALYRELVAVAETRGAARDAQLAERLRAEHDKRKP
jgi:hypothetical protein